MRKFILIFLLTSSSFVKAQQSKTVTGDSPFVSDGIEYGYSLKMSAQKK